MTIIDVSSKLNQEGIETFLKEQGFIPVSDQLLFKFNTGWEPSKSCVIDSAVRSDKKSLHYSKEVSYSLFFNFILTVLISEDLCGNFKDTKQYQIKLDMKTDSELVTVYYKINCLTTLDELAKEIRTALEITGADT